MGHVQTTVHTTIRKRLLESLPPPLSYAIWPLYKPDWNVLLTLTVDSPFCSNIRHPNEGQMTAVKLEHPLAVITWLYHDLTFLPTEAKYTFFKFSSNILFDHGLYPS